MGKVSAQNFVVVSHKNVSDIARKMSENQGNILITDIGYCGSPDDVLNGNFNINLFSRFLIKLKRNTIYCKTEGSFKHSPEERSYFLTPRRQPTGNKQHDLIASWAQRLELDVNFDLRVYSLNITSRGLIQKHSLVLYIPRPIIDNAQYAFTHAFNWLATKWDKQEARSERPKHFIVEKHIQQMVQYILDDLRTGAVMQHNTEAGVAADVAVGIG